MLEMSREIMVERLDSGEIIRCFQQLDTLEWEAVVIVHGLNSSPYYRALGRSPSDACRLLRTYIRLLRQQKKAEMSDQIIPAGNAPGTLSDLSDSAKV